MRTVRVANGTACGAASKGMAVGEEESTCLCLCARKFARVYIGPVPAPAPAPAPGPGPVPAPVPVRYRTLARGRGSTRGCMLPWEERVLRHRAAGSPAGRVQQALFPKSSQPRLALTQRRPCALELELDQPQPANLRNERTDRDRCSGRMGVERLSLYSRSAGTLSPLLLLSIAMVLLLVRRGSVAAGVTAAAAFIASMRASRKPTAPGLVCWRIC